MGGGRGHGSFRLRLFASRVINQRMKAQTHNIIKGDNGKGGGKPSPQAITTTLTGKTTTRKINGQNNKQKNK